MTRSWLAALVLLPLLGCASKVVSISVTVLTKSCDTSTTVPKPTTGVDHYRAVITAADIDPITQNFAAGAAVQFDQIPPGSARTLAITGYQGDPSSGGATVKAFGQSRPFDVPSDPDQTVAVTVLLKPAGVFASVTTIADQTKCTNLTVPRAGHTATLLSDGRVLIAGGYSLVGDGGAIKIADGGVEFSNFVYSAKAEIFDPATNTTKAVADMFDPATHNDDATAFHTATLLNNGQVLIAGGEEGSGATLDARPNTITYDVASDSWVGGEMEIGDGGVIARSHHAAAVDSLGRVVIMGGVTYVNDDPTQPQLVSQTLWMDPNASALPFHAVLDNNGADAGALPGSTFALGREGATAVSILDGVAILGIGGDQFTGPVDPEIAIFLPEPDGGAYWHLKDEYSSTQVPLRTQAGVATLGTDGRKVIVAGGTGVDGNIVNTTSVVDSIDSTQNQSLPTSGQSVNPCAAMIADGRTLVEGGELDPVNHQTSGRADLYALDGDGGVSGKPTGTLMTARFLHTCTALPDGSVLITGGVSELNGNYKVLDTMELYTPVPLQ